MSIYRGPGGSGDAVNDASSEATLVAQLVVEAQTAEANASTSATAAANSASSASSSATAAQTARTNAETAETNAELAEANAEAAQAAAEAAQLAAEAAQTAAELAETNAETAETNAETAQAAAATSATNASNSASAAATSATNAATSASAAATSATNAAASYDAFDDRYLGSKASNPTVDNDGNALITGALYYNTVSSEMRVWEGTQWAFIGASGASGVNSFNTRFGDVTLTSSDVTTALTYTPLAPAAIGTTVQAYDADLAAFALKTAPTGDVIGSTDTQTLTNKTIALGSNTVSGTLAQFNTAVTDADLVSITGTETLTNKTLTSPVVTGGSIDNTPIGATTANTGAFTTLSATGVTTVQAGTVSAPAITTTGDTNTGIFFPAADTIAFTEGGVESMRIDSSGNVGIGTTTLTNALTVSRGSGVAAGLDLMSNANTTSTAFFVGQGSLNQGFLYNRANEGLYFGTNNTERMRIDSAGNVGIGVTPSFRLDAANSISTAYSASNTGNNTISRIYNSDTTNGIDATLRLEVKGATAGNNAVATISAVSSNSNQESILTFGTRPSSGAPLERMRIDSAGNLLITNAGGYIGLGNNQTNFPVVTYPTIYGTTTGGSGIFNEAGHLVLQPRSSGALRNIVFATGNPAAERMRIDSSGNVGIGVTSPDANLSVGGDAVVGRNVTSGYGVFHLNGSSTGTSRNGSIRKNYDSPFDLRIRSSNSTNESPIIFETSSDTEAMRINSTGEVGIGLVASGIQLSIDAKANNAIQTTQTGLTAIQMISTDASASGMNIQYYKDSASPAASDSISLFRSFGNSSTGVQREYSRITTFATVVTNGSEDGELRLSIINDGAIFSSMRLLDSTQAFIPAVYNATTASAANVFVASGGQMSRSTSSIQYKTDVEDLAQPNSANIYNMRPVWYRSTCENDNKDWSWYGLIAEEVADIDPRLVHWGYANDQYDITYIENDGQKEEVKTLKEDAVMQPEGVQYDRLTVLLIQEMKVLKAEMEGLKAKVAALEAA